MYPAMKFLNLNLKFKRKISDLKHDLMNTENILEKEWLKRKRKRWRINGNVNVRRETSKVKRQTSNIIFKLVACNPTVINCNVTRNCNL